MTPPPPLPTADDASTGMLLLWSRAWLRAASAAEGAARSQALSNAQGCIDELTRRGHPTSVQQAELLQARGDLGAATALAVQHLDEDPDALLPIAVQDVRPSSSDGERGSLLRAAARKGAYDRAALAEALGSGRSSAGHLMVADVARSHALRVEAAARACATAGKGGPVPSRALSAHVARAGAVIHDLSLLLADARFRGPQGPEWKGPQAEARGALIDAARRVVLACCSAWSPELEPALDKLEQLVLRSTSAAADRERFVAEVLERAPEEAHVLEALAVTALCDDQHPPFTRPWFVAVERACRHGFERGRGDALLRVARFFANAGPATLTFERRALGRRVHELCEEASERGIPRARFAGSIQREVDGGDAYDEAAIRVAASEGDQDAKRVLASLTASKFRQRLHWILDDDYRRRENEREDRATLFDRALARSAARDVLDGPALDDRSLGHLHADLAVSAFSMGADEQGDHHLRSAATLLGRAAATDPAMLDELRQRVHERDGFIRWWPHLHPVLIELAGRRPELAAPLIWLCDTFAPEADDPASLRTGLVGPDAGSLEVVVNRIIGAALLHDVVDASALVALAERCNESGRRTAASTVAAAAHDALQLDASATDDVRVRCAKLLVEARPDDALGLLASAAADPWRQPGDPVVGLGTTILHQRPQLLAAPRPVSLHRPGPEPTASARRTRRCSVEPRAEKRSQSDDASAGRSSEGARPPSGSDAARRTRRPLPPLH